MVPSNNHPRFGVISAYVAGGPSSVFVSPRTKTTPAAMIGETATASAYAPTFVTPNCHSNTQAMMRTRPSTAITVPYAAKRPDPEAIPLAICIGA